MRNPVLRPKVKSAWSRAENSGRMALTGHAPVKHRFRYRVVFVEVAAALDNGCSPRTSKST